MFRRKSKAPEPTYPLFYLHIPKCGGTAVDDYIVNRMPEEKRRHKRYLQDADLAHVSDAELHDCEYLSGHLGAGVLNRLHEKCFKFVILREPIDRTMSHYYFWKETPNEQRSLGNIITNKHNFQEFCEFKDQRIIPQIANLQTWMLFCGAEMYQRVNHKGIDPQELLGQAKENLHKFDYVGFQHTMKDDLAKIAELNNLTGDYEMAKQNKTSKRPKPDDLAPEERKAAQGAVGLDIELYNYALEHFA